MTSLTVTKKNRQSAHTQQQQQQQKRVLCKSSNDSVDDDRHCVEPDDYDLLLAPGDIPGLGQGDLQVDDDDANCKADEYGSYGIPTGTFEVSVLYKYQLQTSVNVTEDELTSEILHILEKSLADLLVPAFFDCTKTSFSEMSSQNELPVSEIVGMRMEPEEMALDEGERAACVTPLRPGAGQCFIIQGGFILIGNSDITWSLPLAHGITQLEMNMGFLDDAHPEIVDVMYLAKNDPNNDGLDNAISGAGDSSDVQESSSAPAWPWVLLGAGLAMVGILLWSLRRRRAQQRRHDNAQDSLQESEAQKQSGESSYDVKLISTRYIPPGGEGLLNDDDDGNNNDDALSIATPDFQKEHGPLILNTSHVDNTSPSRMAFHDNDEEWKRPSRHSQSKSDSVRRNVV